MICTSIAIKVSPFCKESLQVRHRCAATVLHVIRDSILPLIDIYKKPDNVGCICNLVCVVFPDVKQRCLKFTVAAVISLLLLLLLAGILLAYYCGCSLSSCAITAFVCIYLYTLTVCSNAQVPFSSSTSLSELGSCRSLDYS